MEFHTDILEHLEPMLGFEVHISISILPFVGLHPLFSQGWGQESSGRGAGASLRELK